MARSTLVDVIETVRDLSGAGPAEWTKNDQSYFDDDVLQRILDTRRRDAFRVELVPVIDYQTSGSISYYQYEPRPALRHLEQTDGGTAVFIVETGTGDNVGTANYSVDYRRGVVTFTADQRGTAYYLTARAYDVYGAAADVLEQWATHEAMSFDVRTPEVDAKRSQKAKALQAQADRLRRQAWVASFEAARGDVC